MDHPRGRPFKYEGDLVAIKLFKKAGLRKLALEFYKDRILVSDTKRQRQYFHPDMGLHVEMKLQKEIEMGC